MRIQHNIMAMNAYRNYTNNVSAMKKNLEKLSSGYKINRAGDDAAGLAISEKMRAQITGLQQAQANAKSGINLVQTAEGALTEVHDMLNRMVKLADQSANGTYDNTTDRNQMQKEIKQLLSEINRIADSSNFNGINLLDGTLGLNTDAFEVGKTAVAATEAVAAGSAAAALGTIHGGASVEFNNAYFEVNLKGLEIAHAANGKATMTVGGVKLTSANLGAASATATAVTIAGKFTAAYTATSASTTFKFGGLDFRVTNDGAVLKFTAVKDAGKATVASATEITASKAATFNANAKGAAVVVTGAKDDTVYDHAIENVERAVEAKSGGLFGADLDLDGVVADGNKLVVGSKTYTFKMSEADSTINGSDVVIDSRKFTSASAQTAEAVRLLATQRNVGGGVNISAKDGTHIHVDMTDSAAQTAKASTEDDFKALFKVSTAAQAAKGAGVELKVTDSEIKDGNTLNIDGKKFVFNTKGVGTATDVSYIKISDGIDGLKTALTAAGYDVTKTDDKLTIRTAVKAGADPLETKAPTILGKGLTLQIGDTSDDFNQLNVAVQDMHTWSLGIDNLDISTEEAAQAAVDKIKAAINVVSDVRGSLGATQNRLDHTINNLSVMTENIQDAESTIRDTDVAEEMMAYTKNNILIQSAQAMLAQANQVPQGVLQLLQ